MAFNQSVNVDPKSYYENKEPLNDSYSYSKHSTTVDELERKYGGKSYSNLRAVKEPISPLISKSKHVYDSESNILQNTQAKLLKSPRE
jgi:hypothetical protein